MHSWWMALRPKTLSAALAPIFVGTAVAAGSLHQWDLWISACALFAVIFIQIATNLFNDAIDFEKGADTHERLGPVRVTQSGLLSKNQVMRAGAFCLVVAFAFGVPLVIHGGWPIVIIGLVSIVMAYAYTGGPFPLAYRGLGDVFVFIFFGLVAVGGLVWLHTGAWNADALVAGSQVGLLGTVLIAINNLRDHAQDRSVGKKTLAARFGVTFARREIFFLLSTAYLLNFWWMLNGHPWAALLPLASLPLAWKVLTGVYRTAPSAQFNRYLAQAAGTQVLFGGLLTLGLVL